MQKYTYIFFVSCLLASVSSIITINKIYIKFPWASNNCSCALTSSGTILVRSGCCILEITSFEVNYIRWLTWRNALSKCVCTPQPITINSPLLLYFNKNYISIIAAMFLYYYCCYLLFNSISIFHQFVVHERIITTFHRCKWGVWILPIFPSS